MGTTKKSAETRPVQAEDVAAYIVKKRGGMTAMKLQKLVYYSQAWSLVWDEAPLFKEQIQAWLNGPVVRALYNKHKGSFTVSKSTFKDGDPSKLSKDQRDTVDAVLGFYGNKTAQWLSDLTHKEAPWKNARAGFGAMQNSETPITHAAMSEYYSAVSLASDRST